MNRSALHSWVPRAQGLLRIVAAFLFLQHGTAKLFAFPARPGQGTVELLSRAGVAGVLEVVGGALLLLGLFTRPVAFVLSGEMAFAYFLAHAPQGTVLSPFLNGGEPAVLFCFLWLFFAVAGAGSFSVDAARGGAGPRAPRDAPPMTR